VQRRARLIVSAGDRRSPRDGSRNPYGMLTLRPFQLPRWSRKAAQGSPKSEDVADRHLRRRTIPVHHEHTGDVTGLDRALRALPTDPPGATGSVRRRRTGPRTHHRPAEAASRDAAQPSRIPGRRRTGRAFCSRGAGSGRFARDRFRSTPVVIAALRCGHNGWWLPSGYSNGAPVAGAGARTRRSKGIACHGH
jgi:hypothetical protein